MALKRIQKRIKNPLIFGSAGFYALLGAIIGSGLIPIPFLGTWVGAWLGIGLGVLGGFLGALVGRQIAKFINAMVNLGSLYKLDRSITTLGIGLGSLALISNLITYGVITLPATAPLIHAIFGIALALTAFAAITLITQQAFRAYAYLTTGYTHPEKYILSNNEKDQLQRKLQLTEPQIITIRDYLVNKVDKHKATGKIEKEDAYKMALLAFKTTDAVMLKQFVVAEFAKKSFNASPEKNLNHTDCQIYKQQLGVGNDAYTKARHAENSKWTSAITAKKRLLTAFAPFLKDDIAAVFEQKDVLAEAQKIQPREFTA